MLQHRVLPARARVGHGHSSGVFHLRISPKQALRRCQPIHCLASHIPAEPEQQAPKSNLLWKFAGASALAVGALCLLGNAALAGPGTTGMASITASWSDVIWETLFHWLGKVTQISILGKLVLVLTSTVPAILFFSTIYSSLTSTEFKASCIKFYVILNRLPGAAVLNEKTVPAALLVNIAFFFGLFTFAIILGVVTDEVKTTYKNIESGRFAVRQTGHLVVCGWSLPLLHQLAAAKQLGRDPFFRKPVCVLANMPKAEMDSAIAKWGGGGLDVQTRSGDPAVPADLAMVAAERAASILWLCPSMDTATGSAEGAGLVQAAVALATLCPNLPMQNVVMQVPQNQERCEDLASFHTLTQQGRHIQLLKYNVRELVYKMMALTAAQPGILRVAQQLLGPLGASLRFHPLPQALRGRTYCEVRRAYADGIVCGYACGEEGPVELSPSDATVMRAEDNLVILSKGACLSTNTEAPQVFALAAREVGSRLKLTPAIKYCPRPCHIIVISQAPLTPSSLDMGSMTPKGSSVVFIVPSAPSGTWPVRKDDCTYRYLVISSQARTCCTRALLHEAGIKEARSVVLTGLEGMKAGQADAVVTSTLLLVQDAARSSGRQDAPHFVAQVQKKSTLSTLHKFLNDVSNNAASTTPRPALPALTASTPFALTAEPTITPISAPQPRKGRKGAAPTAPPTAIRSPTGLSAPPAAPSAETSVGPTAGTVWAPLTATGIDNPELFRADDLLSGVLAQSASQAQYLKIVHQLTVSEGVELYLRNPAAFGLPIGDLLVFADVAETIRVFGETAIGLIRADGSTLMAPEPSVPLNFQVGDKIVVLATELSVIHPKKLA